MGGARASPGGEERRASRPPFGCYCDGVAMLGGDHLALPPPHIAGGRRARDRRLQCYAARGRGSSAFAGAPREAAAGGCARACPLARPPRPLTHPRLFWPEPRRARARAPAPNPSPRPLRMPRGRTCRACGALPRLRARPAARRQPALPPLPPPSMSTPRRRLRASARHQAAKKKNKKSIKINCTTAHFSAK